MQQLLPINCDDLLQRQGCEPTGVEFKASWDSKTTGTQVMKTLCAFANDLQNLNGGYLIIGVAEENGQAVLPPQGLDAQTLENAQKWIRGNARRIDPEYQPVMAVETVGERHILVLWAPASETRPHRVSDGSGKSQRRFYVRLGSETVDAEPNGQLDQLIQLTARVPFDDRRSLQAGLDDLREAKVREFLKDIRSGLLGEKQTKQLYRKLRIAVKVNGHDAPKNIGLLMFSDDPETWFPGARIEVVQFRDDASGDVIEETIFKGSLQEQLRSTLSFLERIATAHYQKQANEYQVKGWVSYPLPALREALVNAVYHRSYEKNSEPTKVYLYPDRIEVISYPGPVPGINNEHLAQQKPIPPVPARNRRIGEFLKELRLAEGRGTGLPKIYHTMRDNGSGDPVFDFDEDRTYFRVTLPAHPEYSAISALRDAAHLKAINQETQAFQRIENAWKATSHSPTLAAEYIRLLSQRDRLDEAVDVHNSFTQKAAPEFLPFVTNVLIEVLHKGERKFLAKQLLDNLPTFLAGKDALSAAISARRMGEPEKAHQYFERSGDAVFHDVKHLHEFAQTKMKLAGKHIGTNTGERLNKEAKELLERVLQMDADPQRHAYAWRDLARTKKWLQRPNSEVDAAYQKAIALAPADSTRFAEEYARWKETAYRD